SRIRGSARRYIVERSFMAESLSTLTTLRESPLSGSCAWSPWPFTCEFWHSVQWNERYTLQKSKIERGRIMKLNWAFIASLMVFALPLLAEDAPKEGAKADK